MIVELPDDDRGLPDDGLLGPALVPGGGSAILRAGYFFVPLRALLRVIELDGGAG